MLTANFEQNPYTTIDLINDLLQNVPDFDDLFRNLSKTKLLESISIIIFNKGKHFLKHILSKIRNSNNPNYNPNYKFSLKTLKIADIAKKSRSENFSFGPIAASIKKPLRENCLKIIRNSKSLDKFTGLSRKNKANIRILPG